MNEDLRILTSKLKEIVLENPNKVALQIKTENGYKRYTYEEFYESVKYVANFLNKFHIKKGDKIAIVSENRPEWGILYFGILFSGAIAVPLDSESNKDEFDFYLSNSESKAVIVSKRFLSVFENGEKDKTIISDIIFHPISDISYDESISDFSLYEPDSKDIASIIYTSGTTGKPKGVILTQNNFYSNFESIEKLKVLSSRHNVLSILPLHHSFPFMVNFIIPLFSGSTITYISSLRKEELFECMQETGVTVLVGVPQIFYMFYRYIDEEINKINFLFRLPLLSLIEFCFFIRKYLKINLSKLLLRKIHKSFGNKMEFFVSGGAKLDETAAKFLTKMGFTIVEGYGLTETSPVVTFNSIKNPKIGSVGLPIPFVEVKIIEPDEEGVGEIAIKGSNVMQGYYKRYEETQEVLKDGWFYSGDLGFFDKQGYLFITGRKKELIILSSGKNISPEEVEFYYGKSPYIKELCVLSIGEQMEEKLVAVIVPDFEYFREQGITTTIYHSIKWSLESLSKNYPAYKRIMGFVITKTELPRTRLEKLKRFEIKDMYIDELLGLETTKPEEVISLSDEDLRILASSTWDGLTDVLEKTFRVAKEIRLDDHLELDLGIDSLTKVELISELERVFDIKISEMSMMRIFTIKELMIELEKQAENQGPLKKKKAIPLVSVWKEILTQIPSKDLVDRVTFSTDKIANVITIICYRIVYSFFRIFFGLKVTGAHNLPKDTAFILCSNHNSYFDGFLIAVALPIWLTKKLFFLIFRYYFELPIVRSIVRFFKIIPIDPNKELIDAMQASAYVLEKGYVICIFPEGERSIDGKVKTFKHGIGILAKELNIKLVPVFIKGSYEAWPRGQKFPKLYPIEVRFGKSFETKDLKEIGIKLGAQNDHEAIALGIREEVAKLQDK